MPIKIVEKDPVRMKDKKTTAKWITKKPKKMEDKETTAMLMKGGPGKGPHTGKMQKLHDIVSKSGKLAQELKKHKK